jgi:hypothetical protein
MILLRKHRHATPEGPPGAKADESRTQAGQKGMGRAASAHAHRGPRRPRGRRSGVDSGSDRRTMKSMWGKFCAASVCTDGSACATPKAASGTSNAPAATRRRTSYLSAADPKPAPFELHAARVPRLDLEVAVQVLDDDGEWRDAWAYYSQQLDDFEWCHEWLHRPLTHSRLLFVRYPDHVRQRSDSSPSHRLKRREVDAIGMR